MLFVHYPTPYNQHPHHGADYLFTTQHRTTSISTIVLTICSLPNTVQPASPPWCWLFVHYPTPYNQHLHHGADYLFTTQHRTTSISTMVLTICSLPNTVQPASPPWCWLFVHYPTPYNQHLHHSADYLFTTQHRTTSISTMVLTICSLPNTIQPASPPWCWLFVHYPTP